MKTKVLILVGPTASGKSDLAVRLARKFNGEIISADSRQVYRGLNIGTGKITKKEMCGIPHHLLDVAHPKKVFNADDYARLAREKIADIAKRGKFPIVAGGTGFYIDALVGRVSLASVPPDEGLRKSLEIKSTAQLYAMIQKLDPKRAAGLSTPSERNNRVRLIRAIEIASSGENLFLHAKDRPSYDTLWIGIAPDEATLKHNITIRLFARIRQGMIAEARHLHTAGLSYKRMEGLGLEYRSLARFLRKAISLKELESELQGAIWKYAKRQITYWKRNKDIEWFDPKESAALQRKISTWLKK